MPPQDEEEIQRLLLDKVNRLPSAGLLYLLIAGSSGVFGGAWWLGLDSAPDRHTGTQAREYREEHQRLHERDANGIAIDLAQYRTEVESLRGRVETYAGELREFGVHIEHLQGEFARNDAAQRIHHEQGKDYDNRTDELKKSVEKMWGVINRNLGPINGN